MRTRSISMTVVVASVCCLLGSGACTGELDDGPGSDLAYWRLDLPSLPDFVASVEDGTPNVRGAYARYRFASPVVEQPGGYPAFVSTGPNDITEFGLAADRGSTGLLAHNYLVGAEFSNLFHHSRIELVRGNGTFSTYEVYEKLRFQALSPRSPYSRFLDLADPSAPSITASELFELVYERPGDLILQTCIAKDGEESWGRLFVIATPFEDPREPGFLPE